MYFTYFILVNIMGTQHAYQLRTILSIGLKMICRYVEHVACNKTQ